MTRPHPQSTVPRLPLLLILAPLVLAGCGWRDAQIPGVYRVDIQQGNVVTQEMLDQLEPGMEKRQVLYVLGTPLLVDTFNADRWDYLYRMKRGRFGQEERYRVSLFFENERLARLDGDRQPGEGRATEPVRRERVVVVPPQDSRGGILGALTPGFLRPDRSPPAEAAEPAEVTPTAPAVAGPVPEVPSLPATDASPTPAAGVTPEDPDADADGGFFRRLVDRFRQAREGEETAPPPPIEGVPDQALPPSVPQFRN